MSPTLVKFLDCTSPKTLHLRNVFLWCTELSVLQSVWFWTVSFLLFDKWLHCVHSIVILITFSSFQLIVLLHLNFWGNWTDFLVHSLVLWLQMSVTSIPRDQGRPLIIEYALINLHWETQCNCLVVESCELIVWHVSIWHKYSLLTSSLCRHVDYYDIKTAPFLAVHVVRSCWIISL